MCILHFRSPSHSFKDVEDRFKIPVYRAVDIGDKMPRDRVAEVNRISFPISSCEWDQFKSQTQDATNFLNLYENQLIEIIDQYEVNDAVLDFPTYSRLNEEIAAQTDMLPRELIIVSGKIGLSIDITSYSPDFFDEN